MNRGLERRAIVHDDEDRGQWARLLDRVARRCDWHVFAYALLDNHFHLFLRIPQPNLSIGMHDLQSGYATLFNKRHDRVGPLFGGRFKSLLVELESYGRELSRYVHLNPVRAGAVDYPGLYRWCSFRFYLDPHGAPPWLDWKTILAEIGSNESAARAAYKKYVEAGVETPPDSPFDKAVDGWILGSGPFVERMRPLLDEEAPDGEEWISEQISCDTIVQAVARVFEVTPDRIRQPGGRSNQARDAAIWLIRELTGEPVKRLGVYFGGVGKSAISEATRRARMCQECDEPFRQLVETVRGQVVQSSIFAGDNALRPSSRESANE